MVILMSIRASDWNMHIFEKEATQLAMIYCKTKKKDDHQFQQLLQMCIMFVNYLWNFKKITWQVGLKV